MKQIIRYVACSLFMAYVRVSRLNILASKCQLIPDYAIEFFSSFAFLATLREIGFFHAKPQSPQRNRKEEKEEINVTFCNA